MGASLAYLKEPNKDIEQEGGSNDILKYAAASMQGWRLNMVSTTTHKYSFKFISVGGFTHCSAQILRNRSKSTLWCF
jgi:hypothetical protein